MDGLKFETRILPAHWASYLVNADMTDPDIDYDEIETYLKSERIGWCADVSDEAEFRTRNDFDSLGGDCLEYTFQVLPETLTKEP